MRATYKSNIITNEEGQNYGFFFGNGGCAEHEWGIKRLVSRFGIDNSILGMEGRKITKIPEELKFVKYKKKGISRAFIYCPSWFMKKDTNKDEIIKEIEGHYEIRTNLEDNSVSASWCEENFCIYVTGEDNVTFLERLNQAFVEKDVCMWVGSYTENPFDHGGLIFMILSLVSDEEKKVCYDTDVYYKKLTDAAAPILKKLKDADKKYYACSPEWTDETESTLRFWLNPCDQQENYWGWVSEKDLLDWIENKGTIPGHGRKFEKEHPEEYKELHKEVKLRCGLR